MGSLLGIWFADFAYYADSWYLSPTFIVGFILFAAGMFINRTADDQLINLPDGTILRKETYKEDFLISKK